jgi:hypothetical protein
MELKCIKKCTHLKLKCELCNKIVHARTSVEPTKQRVSLLYVMPKAALTMPAMCNIGTSIAIAFAIALTTTNIERSSNCNRKDDRCNNQPKNLGYEKPRSNSKVQCSIHSFPDKPAKHSWADCSKNLAGQPDEASLAKCGGCTPHCSIIATSATTTAVQWRWIVRRLPTTEALTIACPATLMMPLSPSWLLPLRTRKWQRRLNAAIHQKCKAK